MAQWDSESQAREEIKNSVREYYRQFMAADAPFAPGDRIPYAGRYFDE